MSLTQAIIEIIGSPPAGYEIIVWVVAAQILLFLLTSAFSILGAILNWVGGRR